MTIKNLLFPLALLLCWFVACTPKVVEETAETPVTTTVTKAEEGVELSPCPKFWDAPDQDEAETNYVLYRDNLKRGDWDTAFDYWKKVYAVAPAADGQRNTLLADGITFYEHYMYEAKEPAEKEKYFQKIFEMYDKIEECYPQGAYVKSRKAFDYFYKYPEKSTKEEMYRMFKESMDEDGDKAQYFVLNPFTSLIVDLYFDKKISLEEAKTYQQKVRDRLALGLEKCKGSNCEAWKIIEEYVPVRLEAFERIKDFYDCAYYTNKYYPEFQESPTDCDVIRTVYSRFKFAGCSEEGEEFKAVVAAGNEHCKVEPKQTVAGAGYECLRNADYKCAVEKFEQAANETTDIDRKATYTLLVAKIYNAHLKSFSKARQYANKAADIKPNWGEPFILIGRLYASSGPLCGPGRGWDSQVVVWPAIDMWSKAKRIDPSVAAEANKWINRYSQYMPSKEDVFIRNLKVGSTYRVPCWIQANTTIRTAD